MYVRTYVQCGDEEVKSHSAFVLNISFNTFNMSSLQSILLKTCVEALLQCASAPVVGVVSETVDLPQVQAMNVLKVLFRSTASGSAILQFAAKGMTLAISSLASPHWSIRNAATLLYGEVMGKPLPTVYTC